MLAQHRQAGQRGATVDAGGVDIAQQVGPGGGVGLGVRDLRRQHRHQLPLALGGVTRFERVVEDRSGGSGEEGERRSFRDVKSYRRRKRWLA